MNRSLTHTVTPQTRKVLMAAAVAVVAFGAVTAFAQPAGPPQGMHGGGTFDLMVPKMLEKAKASLNLNTQQQVMWDNVAAQSKNAHATARTNRQQVKAALSTELAKTEPDLAAVAAIADNVEQQNRALRIAARNQWLSLYATFSPEQKGVVRGMLQKRLERMESFGARMREQFQARPPTSG